jgi:hypothetical protein
MRWLFYINEKTNKQMGYIKKDENILYWKYYDSKIQDEKYMPKGLKEALINELKTAYDKIDKCPGLDQYRDTVDKRRKETKYK